MIEKLKRHASRDDGQGLIELIVSLTVLAIGIGSLLTLLTSSALSLQRSDQKGTALVLAEKQIELYRGVGYRDVRLDDGLVSAATGDSTIPYGTANSADSTIPSASGQILDTDSDTNPCILDDPTDPTSYPDQCKPYQLLPGPDHRMYEIDTYIHATTANGGDDVASVTVVVRNGNLATRPILARSASTFSSVNVANVNGKSIVKLSFSAPKADITGVQIANTSISATLTGTNAATGQVNFYVLPAPATPSSPCTGGSWQSLGPDDVSGDGTYSPASPYTPPVAGTYYWYATYTGDSQNKKASSICGLSMARMTVQATRWSPTLSVSTSASTGVVSTAIPGSALTAALSGSSGTTTGAITFMVYGPWATAPTSCSTTVTGLWNQVGTITPNGDGSYNPPTGYTPNAVGTYWYWASFPGGTTNNPATSTCGGSMAKTVVTIPPDTFGISAIGDPQTAGTAFTIGTITAQKPLALGGGTDTSYTGTKTLTFSGPGTTSKGNAPTYPASVTFTNGVASNVSITLYKAETTTLTATQGAITGTSPNSFTVKAKATAGFSIDTVGTRTAGTAFGVTVRTIDQYGNATDFTGAKTVTWTNPGGGNSPSGQAPDLTEPTATSLSFSSIGGQGVAIPTGFSLYLATGSSALKVNETATGFNGTSANFLVKAASANKMAFINCTQPSNPNASCAGSPLPTGNNGTLQANVALQDQYGNIAVAPGAVSIKLTSNSTANYTVTPSPVSIASGGSQSNQFTVKPATNNPATTKITAQVQSGGSWSDISIQVTK